MYMQREEALDAWSMALVLWLAPEYYYYCLLLGQNALQTCAMYNGIPFSLCNQTQYLCDVVI